MATIVKNRSLFLMGFAFLFLMLLLFYMLRIQPIAGEISDRDDELSRVRSELAIVQSKVDEKLETRSEYSQENVQAALPLSDNTEQLLLDIAKLGRDNDVNIQNVTFATNETSSLQAIVGGEQTAYATVKELNVNIALEGTYSSIVRWFDRLQKLPRLITINTFDIVKPSSSEMAKPIVVNVAFTAYFDPSYRDMVDGELLPYRE